MFRSLLLINFIISCFLGTIVYILQFYKIPLPIFINNYLNDFLIIPIVLSLSLIVLRKIREDSVLLLTIPVIVYVFVCYSVFFEYYMPKINSRYTSDIVDVLMYLLGSIWFYMLQKR